MSYVGTIGQKITAEVTITMNYKWVDYNFNYRGDVRHIYTMKDAEDNVYVWKTSSSLGREGDRFEITGTVKEHSEYKGEQQTVLQRVKVTTVIEKALTYEQKKEITQKEQYNSLGEGDYIWEMPYKQYKEHYSDCETIFGSYEEKSGLWSGRYMVPTIKVIIRAGRLKNSGTRGQHYSGYEMTNEKGEKITYRAVSEENAIKRVNKDYPGFTWECTKIYRY